MKTPTVFQLGKLSNVIKEINNGIGSKWTFISSGTESDLSVSLTLPDLTSELESINKVKDKIIKYFGLNENELKMTVNSGYSKIELVLVTKDVAIKVVSR